MKQSLSILLLVLMLTALSLPIFADTILSSSFEDNCSSLESNAYRETANLASGNSYLQQVDFPALTDKTGFELEDFSNPGEIIYYVENPRSVSVSLYRNLASFAILYPDGTLAYDVLPDSSETFQLLPLWIGIEDGFVYCFANEQYYQLYYNEGAYDFREKTAEAVGDIRPYGLSIQTSSDGAVFDPLDTKRTFSAHYTSPESSTIFDETFHADLPANCRYLKIQAEQYPHLPYLDNGFESTMDIASWYKVIIRHVSYTASPQEDEDWNGAPLPEGSIGDTSYGEKDEDKKPQSSKDSKSSSSKSSDAKSSTSTSTSTSTTTSSTVEHSSSSTTTDSNNSTNSTSYTTNYYFYNFSEEAARAIEQILSTGKAPDLSELTGTEESEASGQSTAELPLETVVMDDSASASPGEAGSTVSPSSLNISPESEDESSDSHPFLIYVGLALIILFQIIIILRRPSAPPESHSSRNE